MIKIWGARGRKFESCHPDLRKSEAEMFRSFVLGCICLFRIKKFALPKDLTKDLEIKQASHFPTYYYQTGSTLCVIIIRARSTSSTT